MLNNITNFFNLIATKKVKTQLDPTDLLAIGTKDPRFSGNYQPTLIEYANFVSGLVGGSNGQVLFNDNDTINGASNFFFNKTTNRVGIGTSTPGSELHIDGHNGFGASLKITTDKVGGVAYIQMVSDYVTGFEQNQYGGPGWGWPNWTSTRAGGTAAAPTAASSNYGLNEYSIWSHDGTAGGQAYSMMTRTAENWTPTAHGIYTTFSTTVIGATSISERMRFTSTGNLQVNNNLLLGTSTDAGYRLDVNGTARVQGNLIATGTGYISPVSTIGTYTAFSTFNVVNDGPASIAVDRFSNNSTSPHFNLRKSRGTTTAPLIVQTNDELGYVGFWGHDGTSFQRNGIILVQAQNVAGTTITPRMQFGVGTSAAANQFGITLTSSWNTIIGSYSSDTGEKLQVIGNAKITGSLDLFSATSAGAGSDYFYLDNDPNLSAGANNQTIALMRLRDRGSDGAFTGVNRLGIVMENTAGGQYPFQLFSELGNIRIGYSTIATSSASVSIRGNTNDSSTLTINATANDDSATLRAFNSNQVIIGAGGTLSASATLQVESTTRGFLPPRMTSAQRTAIATPAVGLMVYQTDGTEGLYIYKSTGWVLNS